MASIPLLYETHREQDFDVVVVTVCPPEMQLQRLLDRGMSEEEAHQRIAAQMPAEEKAARGNFVIRTGGTKAETDRQVEELARRAFGIRRGRRLRERRAVSRKRLLVGGDAKCLLRMTQMPGVKFISMSSGLFCTPVQSAHGKSISMPACRVQTASGLSSISL